MVSKLETQLAEALEVARRTKPADCTCDGLHTNGTDLSGVLLATVIEVEETFGGCPAEVRAMRRIHATMMAVGS
jgi:hypothetical protein